ncbi:MAG: PIN domain-containing protein [Arcicella sp.]|nr:PIN domain-containing protein [Arcicella sp.]
MRDFILDANVLMSMLISGKAVYKSLLKEYTFFSSDFAFIEIEKYKFVIQNKTKNDTENFRNFSYYLFSHVHFIPTYLIEDDVKQKALKLVEDVDIKDVAYVALSIQLDLPLLTRDIPLYEGLRKKGYRNVQLFDVFLRNA